MAQASAPIGLKTDQTSGGILADSTMEEGFCVFDKVYALEIYPLPLTLLNSSSCHLVLVIQCHVSLARAWKVAVNSLANDRVIDERGGGTRRKQEIGEALW
jgi:hypothetical protein